MGMMEIDSPHSQGIYSYLKSFLQPLPLFLSKLTFTFILQVKITIYMRTIFQTGTANIHSPQLPFFHMAQSARQRC